MGRTHGYGRVRGALGYRFLGQPKEVFVYPLRRRARQQVAAPAARVAGAVPAAAADRDRAGAVAAGLARTAGSAPSARPAAHLAGCVAPTAISAWARRLSPPQLAATRARAASWPPR